MPERTKVFWIRRRLAKELEIIGDLTKPESDRCMRARAHRLRPELLVYGIRSYVQGRGSDLLYEACRRALVAPPDGSRTSRAARQVYAQTYTRMKDLPREILGSEKQRKKFLTDALCMVAYQAEVGGRIWGERFGLRLRSRLIDLVKKRIKSVNSDRKAKAVTLLYGQLSESRSTEAAAQKEQDWAYASESGPDRLQQVVAAVRAAIERIDHPRLRRVYEVSAEAELVRVEGLEEEFGIRADTLRKYRDDVRSRLSLDPMLRKQLLDLGYMAKPKAKRKR